MLFIHKITGGCGTDGRLSFVQDADGGRYTWLDAPTEVVRVLRFWRSQGESWQVRRHLAERASVFGGRQVVDPCDAQIPEGRLVIAYPVETGSPRVAVGIACRLEVWPGGIGDILADNPGLVPSPLADVAEGVRGVMRDLPSPREILNGAADAIGEAAGTVAGAFSVAAARGGASAVKAFWEEMPTPARVIIVLAGVVAVAAVARKVAA